MWVRVHMNVVWIVNFHQKTFIFSVNIFSNYLFIWHTSNHYTNYLFINPNRNLHFETKVDIFSEHFKLSVPQILESHVLIQLSLKKWGTNFQLDADKTYIPKKKKKKKKKGKKKNFFYNKNNKN